MGGIGISGSPFPIDLLLQYQSTIANLFYPTALALHRHMATEFRAYRVRIGSEESHIVA
jgi:hypothetical protein